MSEEAGRSATGEPPASRVLEQLAEVLEARKQASADASYVARLYDRGLDAILKKVSEEAGETLLAAKGGERDHIVHEVADLWFHCLVLLAYQDIRPAAVLDELQRRLGISGLDEKASRETGTTGTPE